MYIRCRTRSWLGRPGHRFGTVSGGTVLTCANTKKTVARPARPTPAAAGSVTAAASRDASAAGIRPSVADFANPGRRLLRITTVTPDKRQAKGPAKRPDSTLIRGAAAGILAGGLALGVGQLIAGLVSSTSSPVVAVGSCRSTTPRRR